MRITRPSQPMSETDEVSISNRKEPTLANTQRVLMTLPVKQIKPHPTNERLYGPPDDGLVESIREHGIQTPPEVTNGDLVLVSGYRRLAAARKLGISEVQCIIRYDLADPLDRESAIVLANKYRSKTEDQKVAEVSWMAHIEEKKAEQRIKKGQFQKQQSTASLKSDLPEDKGLTETDGEKGRSAEKAGKAVGWGKDKAAAAIKVHEAIQAAEATGDTAKAEDLRTTLNTESVNAALRKVQAEEDDAGVKDRLGNKAPGPLEITFEGADEYYPSMMKALGVIRTKGAELLTLSAGARLTQDFQFAIDRAQSELRNARPYCGCPWCQGHAAISGSPCDKCRETGFLTEAQFMHLSEEQKSNIPVGD